MPSPSYAKPARSARSSNASGSPLSGLVHEIEIRLGVVGHEQIQPAGAVEVGRDDAQSLAAGRQDPGCLAHVLESSIAPIQVHLVGLPGERTGTAPAKFFSLAAQRTGGILAAEVVDVVQVGLRVSVQVGDQATGRPPLPGNSARAGDVGKGAIAGVAIEAIGAKLATYKSGQPSLSKSPAATPWL